MKLKSHFHSIHRRGIDVSKAMAILFAAWIQTAPRIVAQEPVLGLQSSPTVGGAYVEVAESVFDPTNRTVTVPRPPSNAFYRLVGGGSMITGIDRAADDLVLDYFLFAEAVELVPGTFVVFANLNEGPRAISMGDYWLSVLGPVERAMRLRSTQPVSTSEFLTYISAQTRAWTASERQRTTSLLLSIRSKLLARGLNLNFPDVIFLVKTSGLEEGNASYTRHNAVFIPAGDVGALPENVLIHELFHIYSRHHPEQKDALYGILGYRPCNEIAYPETLADRRLTNPDAPRNQHFIEVTYQGTPVQVVPMLYANSSQYKGGVFFDYLVFQFLEVENQDGVWAYRRQPDGSPILLSESSLSGYWEQIGRNTTFTIHPEEILAVNFESLVANKSVTTPRILTEMQRVLGE